MRSSARPAASRRPSRARLELRPDTALVDIGLPDGDGFVLAQQLRALPWPLRVVLISSDADRTNAPAAAARRGERLPGEGRAVRSRAATAHRGGMSMMATASRPGVCRVAIGEDDVLLREGIARILDRRGARRRRAVRRRRRPSAPGAGAPSRRRDRRRAGCRRGARTTAWWPPSSCGGACPTTGVLILSQFCEPAFALELIGERPEGVGYLLKERVGDVDDVPGRHRARRGRRQRARCRGGRPDARASQPGRSAARADAPRARRARRDGRGQVEPSASRRRCSSARPPSRSTCTGIFRKLGIAPASTEHRRVHAVLRYLQGHRGVAT